VTDERDAASVAERLANAAYYRKLGEVTAHNRRLMMTPEEVAADEFITELLNYQMLGVIEVTNTSSPRVPSIEILATKAFREHVQQRAKEIRAERAAVRPQPVPATSNQLGSHASIAAVFNAMEEAVGRAMTPAERDELFAWIGARMAPDGAAPAPTEP
jgi:hypothetical protein